MIAHVNLEAVGLHDVGHEDLRVGVMLVAIVIRMLDRVRASFGDGELEIGNLVVRETLLAADCREREADERNELRLGRDLEADPLTRRCGV